MITTASTNLRFDESKAKNRRLFIRRIRLDVVKMYHSCSLISDYDTFLICLYLLLFVFLNFSLFTILFFMYLML